jgi:hypothetical protein
MGGRSSSPCAAASRTAAIENWARDRALAAGPVHRLLQLGACSDALIAAMNAPTPVEHPAWRATRRMDTVLGTDGDRRGVGPAGALYAVNVGRAAGLHVGRPDRCCCGNLQPCPECAPGVDDDSARGCDRLGRGAQCELFGSRDRIMSAGISRAHDRHELAAMHSWRRDDLQWLGIADRRLAAESPSAIQRTRPTRKTTPAATGTSTASAPTRTHRQSRPARLCVEPPTAITSRPR